MKKCILKIVMLVVILVLLNVCIFYVSFDINVFFKVGFVYVNLSIGIGGMF